MMRPFVYVNMAMTVDGKITSASREYPRLTTEHDRREMDRLRAEADAVLVGAQTLRADNPWLHVRGEEMQGYRRSLGKPDELHRVVVTRSLDLEPECRFFQDVNGGDRIIATVEDATDAHGGALESRAEIWRIGRRRVDLPRLLQRLHERGVERLLVEGGSETNWAFLREDLIDEIYVTLAPLLLGGRDAPTILGGEGLQMSERLRLHLIDQRQVGHELYLRYEVVR